ncbi:hypothetical protein PAXRUDRAFT_137332, partial [Paxillus rubicundulus Ve08.2h10]
QFSVQLAFSMTINKSQGQSVKYVGLDLCTPVFYHGKLYVTLSQCNVKVGFPREQNDTKTVNVVYTEVLRGVLN